MVDMCIIEIFNIIIIIITFDTFVSSQTGWIVFGGNALSFVATLSKIPEEALDQVYLLALISHSEVSPMHLVC